MSLDLLGLINEYTHNRDQTHHERRGKTHEVGFGAFLLRISFDPLGLIIAYTHTITMSRPITNEEDHIVRGTRTLPL
jgi:hypothetical protein